jgi:C1A family cysteine protease
MKTVIAALGFVGAAQAGVETEFAKYVAQYRKSYATTEEYNERMSLFAKKHYEIRQHNAQDSSFRMEHNFMSDWTEGEYKTRLGYIPSKVEAQPSVIENATIPKTVDWRDSLKSMKVTKDQGQCGSCWAFSTIGSVEAHTEIDHGTYTSLSEQQLVDCVPYCFGCEGGNYFLGFSYLQTNGSEAETEYPYKAVDGDKCNYDDKEVVNHHVSGWNVVTPGDLKQLVAHIAQGPVSVAIEADQSVFQTYSSGVIGIKDCGTALDHAVLAIGYGTENGKDYILIRNSWGASWGDHGTVKLEYNDTACACGCSTEPAFVQTKN